MKLYARQKMKGQVLRNCLRGLLPALCFLLSLTMLCPAGLCLVHGTGNTLSAAGLGWIGQPFAAAVPVLLLGSGAVLLIFAAAFAFYARAWVYFSLDKNQTRPRSLLRPSQALRYFRCRAGTLARKALWLALYLLPAAAAFLLLRFVRQNAGVPAGVRAALAVAGAVLLAAGLGFYAVAASRYYLSEYLLYLNPLMPPKEAVASSVKLTRGRLLAITARRLSLLPWALAELLLLPLPFAAVYRRFCAAALCERVFGEDKRRAPAPAVVFYVNRRSRICEAGE